MPKNTLAPGAAAVILQYCSSLKDWVIRYEPHESLVVSQWRLLESNLGLSTFCFLLNCTFVDCAHLRPNLLSLALFSLPRTPDLGASL